MPLVLSQSGAVIILNKYLKNISALGGDDLILRLYVNNVAPTSASVIGDFIEASGDTYLPKTLLYSGWTIAIEDGIVTASYSKQTFTFTGPIDNNATIYGYFITNEDGELIYAERAAETLTPLFNGNYISITPKIALI